MSNTETKATETTTLTVRARAFTNHGIETVRCLVDADGAVRVWDEIAQHYTLLHSLGTSAQKRIRRLAPGAESWL